MGNERENQKISKYNASGQNPVTFCCARGNEHWGLIEGREILQYLRYYKFLKKDFAVGRKLGIRKGFRRESSWFVSIIYTNYLVVCIILPPASARRKVSDTLFRIKSIPAWIRVQIRM